MFRIKKVLSSDSERELFYSTSRSIMFVTAVIYSTIHFITTLGWPDIFSYSIWPITLVMLVVIVLAARLLERQYILANIIWFSGLTAAIFLAYATYSHREILLLLILLPLIAIVTVGIYGTGMVVALIIGVTQVLPNIFAFPPLPESYSLIIILGGISIAIFGWGLSINLFRAIDSASFHFQEARKHLAETRRHRAEVSRMLKEINQTNYQLEHLNQMLNIARKHAEDARADRDRFILAVSHELRSPLNFIIGFSDLMINSPETYAKIHDWPAGLYDDIHEIYRSSNHLLQLINDILDMGQIDARQMTLFRESARLEQVIEEACKMVEASFSQKGLSLSVNIESNLPVVFIDTTRIRQVLLNLFNNSLRFTDKGGITISARREAEEIQVTVTDTGSGIAAEDVPKVFDEFRQVGIDSWRRREGSGLGLSISRRFIEMHGGTMWLTSKVGEGTCFFFTLPIHEVFTDTANESATASTRLSTPPGYYSSRLGRVLQTILIVSTDPAAGDIVSQWLDDFAIVVVTDLDNLSAQIAQNFPQAILVDKILADENRILLQQLPYDIPVLSVVFPSNRNRYPLLPKGVKDYLIKPVTREDLITAVQRLEFPNQQLLLVDDDPAMLRLLQQTLKVAAKQGLDVRNLRIVTAYTGAEALRLVQENKIDAVLLDLDLPDINGWQVLEQIIKQPDEARQLDHVPPQVIIISAHDLPQIHKENGQDIFSIHMQRALSQDELAKLLQVLLKLLQPTYPSTSTLNAAGSEQMYMVSED